MQEAFPGSTGERIFQPPPIDVPEKSGDEMPQFLRGKDVLLRQDACPSDHEVKDLSSPKLVGDLEQGGDEMLSDLWFDDHVQSGAVTPQCSRVDL